LWILFPGRVTFHGYPGVIIHAEGSTSARSRLYRIYLNKYWRIINKNFFTYGQFMNGEWEKFKKNGNYIAFAATRKNQYF